LGYRGLVAEVYHYDFTSLYPWAGTQPLPYSKPTFLNDLKNITSVEGQIEVLMNRPGVYTFTVIDTPLSIRRPYYRITHECGYMIELGYGIMLQHGFNFQLAPHMATFFTDMYMTRNLEIM
jgi:hypothetical protein